MDFVDWVDRVLVELDRLRKSNARIRDMGAGVDQLAFALFGRATADWPEFEGSHERDALLTALVELEHIGLVKDESYIFWKLIGDGSKAAADTTRLWQAIVAQVDLEPEEEQLLGVVNRLGA